jgi:hypothetical protein
MSKEDPKKAKTSTKPRVRDEAKDAGRIPP